MLKEFQGFTKVYIACGYTDLRNGIDGLAAAVQNQFHLDPFDQGTAMERRWIPSFVQEDR